MKQLPMVLFVNVVSVFVPTAAFADAPRLVGDPGYTKYETPSIIFALMLFRFVAFDK